MGSQRYLNRNGGFAQYLYETDSKYEPITINGITAKVVRKKGATTGHDGLPSYGNTSNMYFKEGKNGEIIQGRYYDKERRVVLDIDWGHKHFNDPKDGGDGRLFEKGVAHVHPYTTDKKGNIVRKDNDARLMSNEEIKKLGDIIRHFNPSVKFRQRVERVNN